MNAFQLTAFVPFLCAAVPVYLIANNIERNKDYSRLAGWHVERTSDPEACAKLICTGMRIGAIVMGLVCLLRLAGMLGVRTFVPSMIFLPLVPMVFCIVCAKRKYAKRDP